MSQNRVSRKTSARRRRFWTGALLAPLILFIIFLLLDSWFPLKLPGKESFAVVVTAKDGMPLRSFADANGVWRYPVTIDEVSPRYLEALIHYEDRWFWHHPGVNPLSLGRAVGQWLWYGKPVSGGSTLTMQVARILHPNRRSIGGKLQQMFRALQLEWHLDKRQILTLYLNHAPFGGPLEGVQAASYAYLGKSAKHLSHAEGALLAVLPQSPTALRPDRNSKKAQQARDKVLERMHSFKVWSGKTVQQAKAETVAAWPLERPMLAPLLARRLKALANPGAPLKTTIDARLQARLDALVRDYTLRLPEHSSAAALIVDNKTLAVRAYVGSAELTNDKRYGYIDMVRAIRSPGSTLKPFVYGFALEEGLIHSASLLLDTPQSFDGYRPGDFSGRFSGPVTATAALQRSLNVPAVGLLHRVGPDYFASRLRQGGLKLSYPGGAKPNLSMILGGVGTSLENLVAAYTAIARNGQSGQLRFLPGEPVVNRPMLKPGVAWIVRRMLTADSPYVDEYATPGGARVAWKTGTSYGFRDAWSVGVNNRYTIGVWVGRPDGTPMPGHYGAVTAAPLMFSAFALLPPDRSSFPAAPETVTESTICWPLGKRLEKDERYCQEKHHAWLFQGMTPATFPDRNDDKWLGNPVVVRVNARNGYRLSAGCAFKGSAISKTVVLWPKAARPWLSPSVRKESRLPRLDPACRKKDAPVLASIKIIGMADKGTVRPAGGDGAKPTITLQAEGGSGPIHWLVDGKQVAVTESGAIARYTFTSAGQYRLTAMDEEGNFDSVQLLALDR